MDQDVNYLLKRAREERLAAARAPHERAQQAHLEMAERYEGRISAAGAATNDTQAPVAAAH